MNSVTFLSARMGLLTQRSTERRTHLRLSTLGSVAPELPEPSASYAIDKGRQHCRSAGHSPRVTTVLRPTRYESAVPSQTQL
jgi:hypothetical protein